MYKNSDDMSNVEHLAASYQPNEAIADILRSSRTTLLAGISAAGKDTLEKKVLSLPDYHQIVTHTTRAPRTNNGIMEQEGIEYHFVSEEQMGQLLKNHEMIEVNRFTDKYYGTSIEEFRVASQNGKIALGDIDVNGIAAFHNLAPENVTAIFVIPPDYQTYRTRFENRYENHESYQTAWNDRKPITLQELRYALSVPYYHFLVNDDLERAVSVIDKISHKDIDTFNRGDDEARLRARDLLEAIERN